MYQPAEENEEMNQEVDACSVSGETVNMEVVAIEAAAIDNASLPNIQEQLQVVLQKYQVMQVKLRQVLSTHIPRLTRLLERKNSSMTKCHQVVNLGQITGAAFCLSILLAPETFGLSLVGAVLAIGSYLGDFALNKYNNSQLKALHSEFKTNCTPVWRAYDELLAEIDTLCDMMYEYDVESVRLKRDLKDCIQPKMIRQSSNIVATLGPRALSCSDDVIAYVVNSAKLIPSKLATVFQKLAPFAPIATIACSGYLLITTCLHFFEPSEASKDLISYISKVHDFEKELHHLEDKMKLSIRLLRSEVSRIEERQEFKMELEKLRAALITQQQTFDRQLQAKEEQYERQLQAQQEQFERQLQQQKKQHENQLNQYMQSQEAILRKWLANK